MMFLVRYKFKVCKKHLKMMILMRLGTMTKRTKNQSVDKINECPCWSWPTLHKLCDMRLGTWLALIYHMGSPQ